MSLRSAKLWQNTVLATALIGATMGCGFTSAMAANAWDNVPYIERIDPEYRAGAAAFITDFSSAEKIAAFNKANAQALQFNDVKPTQFITVPNEMDGFGVEVSLYYPQKCEQNSATCPIFAYEPQYLKTAAAQKAAAAGQHPLLFVNYSGGFVIRTNYYQAAHFQMLSNTMQVVVAVPRYRLSDEAPFPAPIVDNYSALKYLMAHAADYHIDSEQLLMMGESAGGGLTAALALYNRDHEAFALKGQMLIYPMLDYRVGSESSPYHSEQNGHIAWTAPANKYAWSVHGNAAQIATLGGRDTLPDGSAAADKNQLSAELNNLAAYHQKHAKSDATPDYFGYFTPSYALDKSNLPPAFLHIGDSDLFANETLKYASDLIEAGNTVEVHVAPGVFHCFEYPNPDGGQSKLYYERLFYFMDQRLQAPSGEIWPEPATN